MATSQRGKSASINKREAVAAAVERYLGELERAPLAVRTKEAYRAHVEAYGGWLAGQGEGDDALVDPRAITRRATSSGT